MLTEIPNCRQIEGEPRRRWFSDSSMDLIAWYSADNAVIGYQLCYGKPDSEHALTWKLEKGFSHNKVDTGEIYGFMSNRLTPILISDGAIDFVRIRQLFIEASANLPQSLVATILETLNAH